MAEELAISMAAPRAWNSRMMMSHSPAAWPCIHVIDKAAEKSVNTANPAL